MMAFKKVNEFLNQFDTNMYKETEIGNNKNIIIRIFEFLNGLNITKKNLITIMNQIAYFDVSEINIPLYLELLSRSLGFITEYSIEDILKSTKLVHDAYRKNSEPIELEEYIHAIKEDRIKKLFLDRNNKYLIKDYSNNEEAKVDLRLASAISLEKNEYKEFMSFIDDLENNLNRYEPMILFRTYKIVRENIQGEKRLYWDILFANEYLVSLIKHNIPIKTMFDKNIYKKSKNKKESEKNIQLDLFSYQEYDKEENPAIQTFQLCTILNSDIKSFREEKELLNYFNKLLNSKELIVLPKLKKEFASSYEYEYN